MMLHVHGKRMEGDESRWTVLDYANGIARLKEDAGAGRM